jgi:hypothetical protein
MGHDYITYNVNEKGDFRRVPAIHFADFTVVVTGKWLKTAKIKDQEWLEIDSALEPEQIIARLKQEKIRADILYFIQRLPHFQPLFDYRTGMRSVAAIPIKSYADWWEKKLHGGARHNVRRSSRQGVVIHKVDVNDALIDGIVKINNETPLRQGRRFWHYGRSAEDVGKVYSEFLGRSEILGAFHNNELIGILQLVYIGKTASISEFLCMYKHRDKKPSNALIAAAVELCAGKSLQYLIYGRYIYDNNADSTLTAFKQSNGFEEFFVPLYFIPLTIKGRIAIKLNIHLGFKRIVPERIKKTARRFRAWILRKQTSETLAIFLCVSLLPILLFSGKHLFMQYLVKHCHQIGRLFAICGIQLVKERDF